jgi:redox-sensing transcriptional repressor
MKPDIPKATVERLPRYLRCLEQLPRSRSTISSSDLARLSGVNSAKVRKDLSSLGSYGVRGVGYHVSDLAGQIRRELGLTEERKVVVVGIGNLGSALASYGGFSDRGFSIVGLYDVDPTKFGTTVDTHEVRSIDALAADVAANDVAIGIITTPAKVAQDVATRLVRAGVPSILNFAPALLKVPAGVQVRQVDLATELQILSFYMTDAESQVS